MVYFENEKEDVDLKKREHSLWVEKYRPDTVENYLGNESIKDKLRKFISEKDIPHLLYAGSPGNGKTSISKLIVKNIDCDYLMINASDENGIDTIRDKVKTFASCVGFKSLKVIILDECLEEGTLVSVLRNGKFQKIKIEELDEKNDLVKSYNLHKNLVEWVPFSLFFKGERDDCIEIEFDNGEVIVCTPEHKWYVIDNNVKKIVKADELLKYMHIFSPEPI